MCGPQIRLCLFTLRPITSKQLNSLTTSITLSWLGDAEVTQPLRVPEVPGSILGSGKGLLLLCFYFCPKHIICQKMFSFLLQYSFI